MVNRKKVILFISLPLIILLLIYFFFNRTPSFISPLSRVIPQPHPLLAYTFENLKKTNFFKSQIRLGREVNETADSRQQLFYFSVPAKPGKPPDLTVSGVLNTPKQPGTYPVIVMFRGYMDKEKYQPGDETEPSAKVFAKNGFITLAPDFLGYGESASPSANAFEERFQTYTTALTLLSSLATLNRGLDASYSGAIKADTARVGIWGHSNGGQIALSVLEISGKPYPAVLWAPVSKSFPYSILYYTDEFDDKGKALRRALADFEKDYDTELFSLTKYLSWIKTAVEIHQGEGDVEVPVWWSDGLAEELEKNGLEVKYYTYPGADHNLLPDAWTSAVLRSVDFYKTKLK